MNAAFDGEKGRYMAVGTFPFGQPVQRVAQADRGSKRVFVLGVYASAVHARWCDRDGKQLVRALAVASEPYIFWRGEGANDLVSAIHVPPDAGCLKPADCDLNGPSGRSIDEHYLEPLGLRREDAWLCDLVPHSCMNRGQEKAIKDLYAPLAERHSLPPVNWPAVPEKLIDDARSKQILAELSEASARVVVTLGDQPLRWFTRKFGSERLLRRYGKDPQNYGRLHDLEIEGRALRLLPLVHPRQAAGLGRHNPGWRKVHRDWMRNGAAKVAEMLA